MANDRANKRQKSGFGFFKSSEDYEAPKEPTMQRGKTFVEAIDKLATNKSNETVFAQLDIDFTRRTTKTTGRKYKKTTTSDSAATVSLAGTIGVMRPNEKTDFVQGVLMPMGKTSYFDDYGKGKVVPSTLTLKTAKMEGRAMKFLSMEDTKYTPKDDNIADKDKLPSEALTKKAKTTMREEKHWGGLALGSFLEEVTGGRGLNITGVGYGMRAMTMAAKWKMRSSNTGEDTGFGARMLKAFPQLGKAAISKNLKTGESLGASALYDDILSGGAKETKVREGHLGLGGSIYKAHWEARSAAKQRFKDKLQQIQTGSLSVGRGKWWDDKEKSTDFKTADSQTIKKLRAEYVDTKLGRHAIAVAPKPYEFAKMETSKQFEKLGLDKVKDRAAYKQAKHALAVNAMKTAKFDTTKVEKQRAIKDKFDAKFAVAQGGSPVTGKFWQSKSSTDFKSLDNNQRKALKQEYYAYKKSKS